MKKILLCLVIAGVAAVGAYAQNKNATKLGAGFDVGVAGGSASSIYPLTGGVSAKLEVPIVSRFSLTLTAGYTAYLTAEGYNTKYDNNYGSYSYGKVASFVPLEVGARVYLHRIFYVEGNVGASFRINGEDPLYPSKSTALVYAPATGVYIPIRSVGIDLSVCYENRVGSNGYGNFDQVAVRAAFSFGIGK